MTPEQVAALYRAGTSVPALAAQLGTDNGQVARLLRRAGEWIRPWQLDARAVHGRMLPRDRSALLAHGYTARQVDHLAYPLAGVGVTEEAPPDAVTEGVEASTLAERLCPANAADEVLAKLEPTPAEIRYGMVDRIKDRPPPPPTAGRPSTAPPPGELAERCATMTIPQLGGFYGVHRSTIYRWLVSAGLDAADGLVGTVTGASYTAASWSRTSKILKMREGGATLAEVGKRFGISRQRVGQIYTDALKNLGVEKGQSSILRQKIIDIDEVLGIASDTSEDAKGSQ